MFINWRKGTFRAQYCRFIHSFYPCMSCNTCGIVMAFTHFWHFPSPYIHLFVLARALYRIHEHFTLALLRLQHILTLYAWRSLNHWPSYILMKHWHKSLFFGEEAEKDYLRLPVWYLVVYIITHRSFIKRAKNQYVGGTWYRYQVQGLLWYQ